MFAQKGKISQNKFARLWFFPLFLEPCLIICPKNPQCLSCISLVDLKLKPRIVFFQIIDQNIGFYIKGGGGKIFFQKSCVTTKTLMFSLRHCRRSLHESHTHTCFKTKESSGFLECLSENCKNTHTGWNTKIVRFSLGSSRNSQKWSGFFMVSLNK